MPWPSLSQHHGTLRKPPQVGRADSILLKFPAAPGGGLVPKAALRRFIVEDTTAVHMMRRETFSAAVLTLLTSAPLASAAGNPVSVPEIEVGRGTWRTQDGSLLACSGSWTAHRA